ncbi:ABC transporter permease [Microvirga brassicacearum]|uniref:ABC transporter permease n=1 Tax=Microvirga brassicacearum TaxID=2580413 RepID=A0A5N3PBV5_9HYPH|nr:ABC transporter permease [Microvirga brassicacearum]KAB0267238.1 ABC transporter permease [Microvirga brassicacearum]
MSGYLAHRLLSSFVVILGAATIIFVAIRAVPGDPAIVMLGPSATPEQIAALRSSYGLDQSVFSQYLQFLIRMVTFDFGPSFRLGMPAGQVIANALPATASLAFISLCVALVAGFPLGIVSALRPNGWVDRVVSIFSMTGQALPSFWVGIMLVLIFSRTLRILPSGGAESPGAILMPALTLALPFLSVVVRLVRSGLLEVLGEGYVQTARAKGLKETRVVGRHALRNMLIPVVTIVGLELGGLLGGAVIVETVFAWPGLGRLLIDSIAARDYSVVQACVVVLVLGFVLINLVVDLLYGFLDPRVRVGS